MLPVVRSCRDLLDSSGVLGRGRQALPGHPCPSGRPGRRRCGL